MSAEQIDVREAHILGGVSLTKLLDAIDQPVIVLDAHGVLRYVNAAFASALGLPAVFVVNRPLSAFVAKRMRAYFVAAGGALPTVFDLALGHVDGREAVFTARQLADFPSDRVGHVLLLAPQQDRLARARQSEVADALHETALDIVDGLDLSRVLHSLTRHAARLLRTNDVLTVLFDEERRVSLRVAALGRWIHQAEAVLPLKDGLVAEVWRLGVPIIINDYAGWCGRSPQSHLDDIATALAAPILCDTRSVGAIMLSRPIGSPPFDPQERALLEKLTAIASVAYANAKLYQATRDHEHVLERSVTARTAELTQALDQVERLREAAIATARSQAAQDERTRLARELHDSVSQSVFGIVLGVRTLQRLHGSSAQPQPASDITNALGFIIELAESALAEMRALIFQLRPEVLEQAGLVNALEKHLDAVRVRYKLTTHFDADPALRCGTQLQEGLYRIAIEAVHNVVKHACARAVTVRLHGVDDQVRLRIQDDGVGFDTTRDSARGMGLMSMRERAAELGGNLQLESAPSHGTVVYVTVPLR
jgi:signal transduction histidine kinase